MAPLLERAEILVAMLQDWVGVRSPLHAASPPIPVTAVRRAARGGSGLGGWCRGQRWAAPEANPLPLEPEGVA